MADDANDNQTKKPQDLENILYLAKTFSNNPEKVESRIKDTLKATFFDSGSYKTLTNLLGVKLSEEDIKETLFEGLKKWPKVGQKYLDLLKNSEFIDLEGSSLKKKVSDNAITINREILEEFIKLQSWNQFPEYVKTFEDLGFSETKEFKQKIKDQVDKTFNFFIDVDKETWINQNWGFGGITFSLAKHIDYCPEILKNKEVMNKVYKKFFELSEHQVFHDDKHIIKYFEELSGTKFSLPDEELKEKYAGLLKQRELFTLEGLIDNFGNAFLLSEKEIKDCYIDCLNLFNRDEMRNANCLSRILKESKVDIPSFTRDDLESSISWYLSGNSNTFEVFCDIFSYVPLKKDIQQAYKKFPNAVERIFKNTKVLPKSKKAKISLLNYYSDLNFYPDFNFQTLYNLVSSVNSKEVSDYKMEYILTSVVDKFYNFHKLISMKKSNQEKLINLGKKLIEKKIHETLDPKKFELCDLTMSMLYWRCSSFSPTSEFNPIEKTYFKMLETYDITKNVNLGYSCEKFGETFDGVISENAKKEFVVYTLGNESLKSLDLLNFQEPPKLDAKDLMKIVKSYDKD